MEQNKVYTWQYNDEVGIRESSVVAYDLEDLTSIHLKADEYIKEMKDLVQHHIHINVENSDENPSKIYITVKDLQDLSRVEVFFAAFQYVVMPLQLHKSSMSSILNLKCIDYASIFATNGVELYLTFQNCKLDLKFILSADPSMLFDKIDLAEYIEKVYLNINKSQLSVEVTYPNCSIEIAQSRVILYRDVNRSEETYINATDIDLYINTLTMLIPKGCQSFHEEEFYIDLYSSLVDIIPRPGQLESIREQILKYRKVLTETPCQKYPWQILTENTSLVVNCRGVIGLFPKHLGFTEYTQESVQVQIESILFIYYIPIYYNSCNAQIYKELCSVKRGTQFEENVRCLSKLIIEDKTNEVLTSIIDRLKDVIDKEEDAISRERSAILLRESILDLADTI